MVEDVGKTGIIVTILASICFCHLYSTMRTRATAGTGQGRRGAIANPL
ncbi:MAG: hypothetical protein ACFB8W_24190 [Elainellaceae cyanobacterium]